MTDLLIGVLTAVAMLLLIIAIGGAMNDASNAYPLPFTGAALALLALVAWGA